MESLASVADLWGDLDLETSQPVVVVVEEWQAVCRVVAASRAAFLFANYESEKI